MHRTLSLDSIPGFYNYLRGAGPSLQPTAVDS